MACREQQQEKQQHMDGDVLAACRGIKGFVVIPVSVMAHVQLACAVYLSQRQLLIFSCAGTIAQISKTNGPRLRILHHKTSTQKLKRESEPLLLWRNTKQEGSEPSVCGTIKNFFLILINEPRTRYSNQTSRALDKLQRKCFLIRCFDSSLMSISGVYTEWCKKTKNIQRTGSSC